MLAFVYEIVGRAVVDTSEGSLVVWLLNCLNNLGNKLDLDILSISDEREIVDVGKKEIRN